MTRRAFLAAAGAAGVLAHARPTRADGTAEAAPHETDGTAEAAPHKIDGTTEAAPHKTDGTDQAALDKTDGTAQAAPYKIGQQPLKLGDDRDGLLYIPRGYKADVAMPLILMLHGAGNTAFSVTYTFEIADDLGVIILAPDSRDEATWDMLVHGFGEDVQFIGVALRDTYARCAVDRKRMAIAGHSDGASYALSLGLGTGDTFGHIMAFSPGVMQPAEAHGKPRIFISHGVSDPIMPIDVTSRRFVPRLKGLGYDVTYREYEGRHGVPPAIVREGFQWFIS